MQNGIVPTYEDGIRSFEGGSIDPSAAPLLSFSGANGGLEEDEFNAQITNSNSSTRVARFFPRDFHAGGVAEGDFLDASGQGGLSGEGSPKSIDILNDFVDSNPSFITKIKVVSQNQSQLNKALQFQRVSPFRDLDTYNLTPSNRQNEYRNIATEVTISVGLIQSNQTFFDYPIQGNEDVTVILFFKAFLSTSSIFERQLEALRRQAG